MFTVEEIANGLKPVDNESKQESVAPPSIDENLLKTRETLENVVGCLRLQVLNNFDALVQAIQKECPELNRKEFDIIKMLLEHMLKSPIKRQMNRISSVAMAVTQFKQTRS